MRKVLSINQYTGIGSRSSIGTPDHPVVNLEAAPSIGDLHRIFVSDGVPLAVAAARKALAEARLDDDVGLRNITHVVATTCTDSANPGYDQLVAKELGLAPSTEKVLLHGVGCSGGLAALRTAAGLALGHAMRGLPARILVLALEVSTTMVRSELDSIHATGETRIGVALFSYCASSVVLTNGLGDAAEPVYDLLSWDHRIIPDTEGDLGFDVDPAGKFSWVMLSLDTELWPRPVPRAWHLAPPLSPLEPLTYYHSPPPRSRDERKSRLPNALCVNTIQAGR